jgi:CheY-like chemotaxis protein
MRNKTLARPRLRLGVLNDSERVLEMLCNWFRKRGHDCVTCVLSDMPRAHEQVPQFLAKHQPDVVVYDVAMPYESSWDLLEVIRAAPSLWGQRFVVTTPNKRQLEKAVGPTSALEISSAAGTLKMLLKAVESAAADR